MLSSIMILRSETRYFLLPRLVADHDFSADVVIASEEFAAFVHFSRHNQTADQRRADHIAVHRHCRHRVDMKTIFCTQNAQALHISPDRDSQNDS